MAQLALALLLVVGGSVASIPSVVLLGIVLVLVEGVRQVWVRWGLAGVEYRRELPQPRGVVGDELPLDLTVWNRKPLPIAWLRVDDEATAHVRVRERPLVEAADDVEVLRNAWGLAPWERVTRHLHILAERRGVHALGPAHLRVGDLFARSAAELRVPERSTWLVRPRTVAVDAPQPANPWGGELRARRGLLEDPTRYAGVRPYQPGDPIRAVHWQATARLGAPVVRRFEPAQHREMLVALDIATDGGPGGVTPGSVADDRVEELCVAAASLVRRLREDGAAVGLAAAAWAGGPRAVAWIAPSSSEAQLGRCLDLLARLGSVPSSPFDRLVTTLLRTLRPGTHVLVLTSRDPGPYLGALRRARRSGYPVDVLVLGDAAAGGAARARAAGLGGREARLDGSWRTAELLRVSP